MRKKPNRPRSRKEMLEVQVVSLEVRHRMNIIKPDYVEMRKVETESGRKNDLKSFGIKSKIR